jgi:hypothetical protein
MPGKGKNKGIETHPPSYFSLFIYDFYKLYISNLEYKILEAELLEKVSDPKSEENEELIREYYGRIDKKSNSINELINKNEKKYNKIWGESSVIEELTDLILWKPIITKKVLGAEEFTATISGTLNLYLKTKEEEKKKIKKEYVKIIEAFDEQNLKKRDNLPLVSYIVNCSEKFIENDPEIKKKKRYLEEKFPILLKKEEPNYNNFIENYISNGF